MIEFSPQTFIRHAGGQSLLWRPRTGGCVVMDGAEPFLRHVGWTARSEDDIVAEIAADFGITPEEVAADFEEFIAPLVADGFLTTEGTENTEDPHADAQGVLKENLTQRHGGTGSLAAAALSAANFDTAGNAHDDSWTPLCDFCREHGIPTELHLGLPAACTERCVHCYLPNYPMKHISFELAEKALREFRAMQGPRGDRLGISSKPEILWEGAMDGLLTLSWTG